MIKYVIGHLKGSTVIHEVECEEVFTNSWELRPGEKRYRILSEFFLDKNGQYSIWYSWAVHDTAAHALNTAAGDIRIGMERAEQKGRSKFGEIELAKHVAAITIKNLEKKDA
jgi:hypothetical protein